MDILKTVTRYRLTISRNDKLNYYKAIIMKALEEIPKPTNLSEAVEALKQITPEEVTQKIKDGEIDPGRSHFGFGMKIRNHWGFWSGSKLRDWFFEKGIRHADDMSGIILETFKRELKAEDWDVEGQIAHYREYWKKLGVNPDKIGADNEQ